IWLPLPCTTAAFTLVLIDRTAPAKRLERWISFAVNAALQGTGTAFVSFFCTRQAIDMIAPYAPNATSSIDFVRFVTVVTFCLGASFGFALPYNRYLSDRETAENHLKPRRDQIAAAAREVLREKSEAWLHEPLHELSGNTPFSAASSSSATACV